MVKRIELVRIGDIETEILDVLRIFIEESLNVPSVISRQTVNPEDAYDSRRQQFHSTSILSKLADLSVSEDTRVLGLVDLDLFIPILTFVFGEAQMGGKAALVSVFRLRQAFYGLSHDESLFLERCEKESIHELGHTFNLVHCEDFECAMYFSNTVEQIDLKENRFCDQCQSFLDW